MKFQVHSEKGIIRIYLPVNMAAFNDIFTILV